MTKNITKNDKIRILKNDNQRLSEENKKLHELSNEQLSNNMIEQISQYVEIMEKLHNKYIELDRLKFIGLMNKYKYQWMIMIWKIRTRLGL